MGEDNLPHSFYTRRIMGNEKERSGHELSEEDFLQFQEDILSHLDRLGVRMPVEFYFGLPEDTDEYHLAGTILFEGNNKVLFYLNNKPKKKITGKRIRYLALHEVIEFLLTDKFLPLLRRRRKVEKGEWDETVHAVLNRLICLVDPGLLQE